ncbi:GGDEF domain-containing protein [Deinococcus radiotolerans]|uniref:GGDEF domain-containing protein n=1 Tax=Deinococcus radiotolerans TaxID=1309407 RepID=A0ABQ2FL29_9DEIO|nr:GGDEF domain-containing protein [Deinococcus radiotolerans]GGL06705.1 hypothetical protein GCM10010844_26930 [Deinococcus radiotolerans]
MSTVEQLERHLCGARGQTRLRVLLDLAAELWDKNPADAVRRARDAAALAGRLNDPGALARATLELGRGQSRLGHYDAARATLQRAITLHEAAGDELGLARSWMGLGTVRSNLGELPQALEAHFAAQTLFERRSNDWFLSACLNNLGVVYQRLEDHTAAMNYSLRALRLATGAGNTVVRISATNNVGNVAMDMDRHEEALSYQTEALHLARVHGSPYNEIVALTNLGILHSRLGQFPQAREHLSRAGELAQAASDLDNLVEVHAELGHMHHQSGQWPDALGAYARALELVNRMGDFYLQARLHLRRGETLLRLHDHAQAGDALRRALNLAGRISADRIASEAHQHLSDLHEQTGDLSGALRHLREHLRLTVAISRAAAERRSAVRLIEHETERSRQVAAAQRDLIEQLSLASGTLSGPDTPAWTLDLLRSQQQLAQQANLDPLTGLFNRRFLEQRLNGEFECARRQHQPLAVAVLDLGPLRPDATAHAATDDVLREISGHLRRQVRQLDVLARLDDHRLALLLPQTSPDGALLLCSRLRASAGALRFPHLPHPQVTLSVGLCTDTACAHPDDMLERAQQLLYAARAAGDGQIAADFTAP